MVKFMKKRIFTIAIIIFAFIILQGTISKAATINNNTYKIDIPNNYKIQTNSEEEIVAVSNDGLNYFSILSVPNSINGTIGETYMETMIKTLRDLYGDTFTLISSDLIESNGCKGCQVKFREYESGIYIYAQVFQFKSDNNIYTIMFLSTNQSYLTSAEKNNIFNSFVIKDTVVSSFGIPFTDVPSKSWYFRAVKYAFDNKMISGTSDTTFSPNTNLTRGMLVTILWRMEGSPVAKTGTNFSDIKSSDYFYNSVKWASSKKIVSGYDNGRFGANDTITRQDLAVMLNNYCRYKNKFKATSTKLDTYKDYKNIAAYAKPAMQWAVGNKVINGSNNELTPRGKATRAQAASMLYNYCMNIK